MKTKETKISEDVLDVGRRPKEYGQAGERKKNKGRKEKGGMGQLLNAEEHCWKETWRGVKGEY